MASIQFDGYVIEKSFYEVNPEFDITSVVSEVVIKPQFQASVAVTDGLGIVRIGILISMEDLEKEETIKCPFDLEVVIKGEFEYSMQSDDEYETIKELLSSNTVAILYPYLRSYVSNLTSMSNQYPAYTLPVFNFVEMLKQENLIEFYDFNEESVE